MTKKALLVGINYSGHLSLKGPRLDVQRIQKLLVKRFGYSEDNIKIMSDDISKNDPMFPTRRNLVSEFENFVVTCVPGDCLLLFFSGHGVSVPVAKSAECIFPVNASGKMNLICSPEMNQIVNKLPKGVKLTVLLDCCHGESIITLPYTVLYTKENEFNLEVTGQPELKGSGDVVLFAASLTEQLSYDIDGGFMNNSKSGGIFTRNLVELLENGQISWLDFLTKLTERTKSYKQTPQMSLGSVLNLNQFVEL